MNAVVYASEIAEAGRAAGMSFSEVREHVQKTLLHQHPTYLGIISAVTYNDRTDRYIVKFDGGSAKATTEVAEFLLTENTHPLRDMRPTVYAHMSDGVIDGVLLVFVSRS